MAPRKPAKAAAKAKIAPKAAAKPAAKASAKTPLPPMLETGAACPCHSPIDAKKYGCWCNCHVMALLLQKGTLLLWLQTAALFVAFNMAWHGLVMAQAYAATAALWLAPEAMQPHYFLLADVSMALVFALLFRLAYTGCGGLVEGTKLGALILLPVALSLLNVLGSQPIPVNVVGLWAAGTVLLGALAGLLGGWLLRHDRRAACC
ncbi:MAG: hypothetical protein INF43_00370 [Alphaproteobacteria bacterium]|nr:hypothetical protein [Alphaproteobacteria bacterium]